VGIIGTGNMGSAMVRGWSRALGAEARMLVWDTSPGALDRVAGCEGVTVAPSVERLVAESGFIVMVVKPKDGDALLRSIAPSLEDGRIVVSAMAGVELQRLRQVSGPRPFLFRVMPNLGVEVGAGMVAVSAEPGREGDGEAGEALRRTAALFDSLGVTVVVPESSLDAVTAVSGTGPALLALAVEGLEDGAVAAGLPRTTARLFVRRAMLGLSRMLVAGEAPAEEIGHSLVPPADPLAQGLAVLEQRGVRSAFEEAVAAAAERARQMRTASSGTR
jgi:pyrroline-5-carboxylate reductase